MAVDPAQLRIVHHPHPVLRERAEPVELSDEVRAVAVRMVELMHEADGVGLAAPQVGLPWRLFVANWTGPVSGGGQDHVFINPELTAPSRETGPHEEGCLSLPDIRAEITRPLGITVTATDLEGQRFTMTDDGGLAARVWQHEFDHLDGVLILDRMTRLDKMANRKSIRALEADR
ncbi:MAG: peptide deformylase [Planctomycetota bacterium]